MPGNQILPPSILRRSVYSAASGTSGGGARVVTMFKPRARPRMWSGGGVRGGRGREDDSSPPGSEFDKKRRRLSFLQQELPHGSSTQQEQLQQTLPTTKKPRLGATNGYQPRYSNSPRLMSSPRTVSFPTSTDDLVTDVWTRPKTKPSEVGKLFYSKADHNRFKAEKKRMQRRIARGGMPDEDEEEELQEQDSYRSNERYGFSGSRIAYDDDTATTATLIDGHEHHEIQEDDCVVECTEDEDGIPTAEEVLRDNESFLQEEDDIPIAEVIDEIVAPENDDSDDDDDDDDEEEAPSEVNDEPSSPRDPHGPVAPACTPQLLSPTASCRRALADTSDGNENEDYSRSSASNGYNGSSKTNDSQSSSLLIASC
mmetsp:Transcript_7223/g.15761  ORF Transcript_7223/g.15761 Transcript_7223/m.15761 type:complete len:370 (-) Transcript_7223:41-1150(-)